jgi:hypothetical protein
MEMIRSRGVLVADRFAGQRAAAGGDVTDGKKFHQAHGLILTYTLTNIDELAILISITVNV